VCNIVGDLWHAPVKDSLVGSFMSEEISIHGKVQDYNQKPIFMIQVSVWREDNFGPQYEVDRTYTNEDGTYRLSVPSGTPITLRFDTHWSITNSTEWHPSVVANIGSKQDMVLNRILMRTGTTSGDIAEIDALTAYQFCAMWTVRQADRESAQEYAKSAVSRLSQMKISLPELDEFRSKLIGFFTKQAESS
jgi:hypothetical protein